MTIDGGGPVGGPYRPAHALHRVTVAVIELDGCRTVVDHATHTVYVSSELALPEMAVAAWVGVNALRRRASIPTSQPRLRLIKSDEGYDEHEDDEDEQDVG